MSWEKILKRLWAEDNNPYLTDPSQRSGKENKQEDTWPTDDPLTTI